MKIAIIGSGISALTAARKLNNISDVTIFDKSKGIGGRIATRRADPFVFDHGAQYFLIKNNDFESFVSPYIESGVVKRWDAYFKEFEGCKVISERQWNENFAHYVGTPNMNAFCKSLAENFKIIKPELGDFYLFPNYLMHTVYPFSGTNEERRSVSFNAKLEFFD